MKIVASTKLTKAQRAMTESRTYGQTSNTVFDEAETKPLDAETPKTLLVICSSDKGLCGGVHSGLSRAARRLMADHPGDYDLVVVGDKSKAQMSRSNPKNLVLTFNGVGKDVPTFADASAIADQICLLPSEYSSIKIMYNQFLNAQSYSPVTIEAYSEEAFKESRRLSMLPSSSLCANPIYSKLRNLRDRRRDPSQPSRVRTRQQPLLGSCRRPCR